MLFQVDEENDVPQRIVPLLAVSLINAAASRSGVPPGCAPLAHSVVNLSVNEPTVATLIFVERVVSPERAVAFEAGAPPVARIALLTYFDPATDPIEARI